MRYKDDRIPAFEFEGRKYRSNTLLNRAWAEADERKDALRVWKARPKLRTISLHMGFMFFGVGAIGFIALTDRLSGMTDILATVSRSIPLWLSVLLLVVGAYGYFLSFRLDDLAELSNLTRPDKDDEDTASAESAGDAFHAKIDAEWHAIISKPGIQPHEVFMQYEEFLKKYHQHEAFWGFPWGAFVPLVGVFTFFFGILLWDDIKHGLLVGAIHWSTLLGVFLAHATVLVALLVYGFVKTFIIKPQADALLTPGPVPRGRSEAPEWDAVRRAANLNHFWRMGGAGKRVPFEAAQSEHGFKERGEE